MTTDHERELDQHLRAIAHALVDDAPDASEPNLEVSSRSPARAGGHRTALVVAAAVVMIGAAGLAGLQLANRDRSGASLSDSAAARPAQVTTVPPTTVSPAVSDHAVRVVLLGDSLASIAEELCTTPAEIADFNGWADGLEHPLFPDDIIEIPPGSCGPVAPTTAVPGAVGPQLSTELEYVVQRGDYLAHIADMFGVSIDDLAEHNEWPEGADTPLLPGQVILIPPGATTQTSTASLPATLLLLGGPLALARRRRRS